MSEKYCNFASSKRQQKYSMNYSDKETEFVVFCIENVAAKMNVSGAEVYHALKESDGINAFLYPSYDMLHSQGKDYIVDETLQYLKSHNAAFYLSKGGAA